MTNIFTLENIADFSEKISIDELYEKKRQFDLNKLALFNKILNRIHVKIKTTSRLKLDEQFCWYVVPEIIIGVPKYDQGACIAYLMDKLLENGFATRYIHPNTIFICWQQWVPSYVRNELKKKTGIVVNEFGKKIEQTDDPLLIESKNVNEIMYSNTNGTNGTNGTNIKNGQNKDGKDNKNGKQYTPIQSYKPSGNLIYNDDLMDNVFKLNP